jgi:hypothetical protein
MAAKDNDDTGWQPLAPKRSAASVFVVSPFNRLARTHAAAVAGDTLIALALAGSRFLCWLLYTYPSPRD